jgi:hypothetical protein
METVLHLAAAQVRKAGWQVKPETLEVPDNVRREIERLQEVFEREREARNRWYREYEFAEQRAERAEAELEQLRSTLRDSERCQRPAAECERAEADAKEQRRRYEAESLRWAKEYDARERAEAERDELNEIARAMTEGLEIRAQRAEAALRELVDEYASDDWRDLPALMDKARALVEGKP